MQAIFDWITTLILSFLSFALGLIRNIVDQILTYNIDGVSGSVVTGDGLLKAFFDVFNGLDVAYSIARTFAWGILMIGSVLAILKSVLNPPSQQEPLSRTLIHIIVGILCWTYSLNIADAILQIGAIPYSMFISGSISESTIDHSNITRNLSNFSPSAAVSASIGSLITIFFMIVLVQAFIRLALEIIERYVVLGTLVVFSPFTFAFYPNPSTRHITHKWLNLTINQTVIMSISVLFYKIFDATMVSVLGKGLSLDLPISLAGVLVMLIAWVRVGEKAENHMQSLGLNTLSTGGSMGSELLSAAYAGSRMLQSGRELHNKVQNFRGNGQYPNASQRLWGELGNKVNNMNSLEQARDNRKNNQFAKKQSVASGKADKARTSGKDLKQDAPITAKNISYALNSPSVEKGVFGGDSAHDGERVGKGVAEFMGIDQELEKAGLSIVGGELNTINGTGKVEVEDVQGNRTTLGFSQGDKVEGLEVLSGENGDLQLTSSGLGTLSYLTQSSAPVTGGDFSDMLELAGSSASHQSYETDFDSVAKGGHSIDFNDNGEVIMSSNGVDYEPLNSLNNLSLSQQSEQIDPETGLRHIESKNDGFSANLDSANSKAITQLQQASSVPLSQALNADGVVGYLNVYDKDNIASLGSFALSNNSFDDSGNLKTFDKSDSITDTSDLQSENKSSFEYNVKGEGDHIIDANGNYIHVGREDETGDRFVSFSEQYLNDVDVFPSHKYNNFVEDINGVRHDTLANYLDYDPISNRVYYKGENGEGSFIPKPEDILRNEAGLMTGLKVGMDGNGDEFGEYFKSMPFGKTLDQIGSEYTGNSFSLKSGKYSLPDGSSFNVGQLIEAGKPTDNGFSFDQKQALYSINNNGEYIPSSDGNYMKDSTGEFKNVGIGGAYLASAAFQPQGTNVGSYIEADINGKSINVPLYTSGVLDVNSDGMVAIRNAHNAKEYVPISTNAYMTSESGEVIGYKTKQSLLNISNGDNVTTQYRPTSSEQFYNGSYIQSGNGNQFYQVPPSSINSDGSLITRNSMGEIGTGADFNYANVLDSLGKEVLHHVNPNTVYQQAYSVAGIPTDAVGNIDLGTIQGYSVNDDKVTLHGYNGESMSLYSAALYRYDSDKMDKETAGITFLGNRSNETPLSAFFIQPTTPPSFLSSTEKQYYQTSNEGEYLITSPEVRGRMMNLFDNKEIKNTLGTPVHMMYNQNEQYMIMESDNGGRYVMYNSNYYEKPKAAVTTTIQGEQYYLYNTRVPDEKLSSNQKYTPESEKFKRQTKSDSFNHGLNKNEVVNKKIFKIPSFLQLKRGNKF